MINSGILNYKIGATFLVHTSENALQHREGMEIIGTQRYTYFIFIYGYFNEHS